MSEAARLGARNLLRNCAGMREGESLLIVTEDPSEEYYYPCVADAVAAEATALGLRVSRREVAFSPEVRPLEPELRHAMAGADRTLFLARLGDQLRFGPWLGTRRALVSYALDAGMLGSAFGRAHHQAFVALKQVLNRALSRAALIRVTCPLGTEFEGPGADIEGAGGDVAIDRFPLSVFAPVPSGAFRGRIAQAGFLTGTGSTYYTPYSVGLEDVLILRFEGNKITGFEGSAGDVARAEAHYAHVGRTLGIDPGHVHSWHAGIHPGCAFAGPAGASPERWGGSAFGNPRVLHFHTCGAYAPGEISVNVIDPTIELDGVPVWERGRLHPERVPGGAEILALYPCAAAAFAHPAQEIGLGPEGRLSLTA